MSTKRHGRASSRAFVMPYGHESPRCHAPFSDLTSFSENGHTVATDCRQFGMSRLCKGLIL